MPARIQRRNRWLPLLAAVSLLGCADDAWVPVVAAESWPEADAMFRSDPRWLGGDGALSIPLGGDRILWLFGDSFVATSDKGDRHESEMVRNTVAIQTGADPTSATLSFAWRTDPDGSPAPFFADQSDEWHWPAHGARLPGGPLFVFLAAQRATPGQGLGFTEAGWRLVTIDNPDDEPLAWQLDWRDGPELAADPTAMLGTAVLLEGPYAYATASARGSAHEGWLARFATSDLTAGSLEPEWWAGSALGWARASQLKDRAPSVLMSDVGSECSLYFEPRVGSYLHVASRGFGATTIAVRSSKQLTGPWSAPEDVMTPPESRASDAFVYAAKAHPELDTGHSDGLAVTYATNAFDFEALLTPLGQEQLYWPRFVRLTLSR